MSGRWLFIVNTEAGHGGIDEAWTLIERSLRDNKVPYAVEFPQSIEQTAQVIRLWATESLGGVVAVGGDGTVHGIVNGVIQVHASGGGHIPIGVVPLGKHNDWAYNFDIPVHKPIAATRHTINATPRYVDVIALISPELPQPLYVVNGVIIGLEPRFADAWQEGRPIGLSSSWTYLQHYDPQVLSSSDEGRTLRQQPTTLLAYTNGKRHLGGLLFAPHATPSDATIELTLIRAVPRWTAVSLLRRAQQGNVDSHIAVTQQTVSQVTIEGSTPIPLLLDGELLTRSLHTLTLEILPQSLLMVG